MGKSSKRNKSNKFNKSKFNKKMSTTPNNKPTNTTTSTTSNTSTVVSRREYQEFPLANKVKLIISTALQSQIMYLHSKIKDIEWCGVLLYSIVEGSIEQVSQGFTLKAEGVYPVDMGTTGYTEHTFGSDTIMGMMDMYPGFEEGTLKWGMIHTHHSMNTFFSGTDMDELHENAPNHNYYLSLIVNHKSQFEAKVAMVAECHKKVVDNHLVIKGTSGEGSTIELVTPPNEVTKHLVLLNCDIEFEQAQDFKTQVTQIMTNRRPTATTYNTSSGYVSPTNYKGGVSAGQTWDYKTQKWVDNPKKELPSSNSGSGYGSEDLDDYYSSGSTTTSKTGTTKPSEVDEEVDTNFDSKLITLFLKSLLSTKDVPLEEFSTLYDGINALWSDLTTAEEVVFLESVIQAFNDTFIQFFEEDVDKRDVANDCDVILTYAQSPETVEFIGGIIDQIYLAV